MTGAASTLEPGGSVVPDGQPVDLQVASGVPPWSFSITIAEAGSYALFTQHLPEEFNLQMFAPGGATIQPIGARDFVATHSHDDAVSSVGLEFERPFHQERLNAWMSRLLREQGNDIFRMKGILSIAGSDQRFVFQGVHMLFDGRPDAAWGSKPRLSQVVFIGKNLDRAALREGLTTCLA